jgi:hypothetical protein
VSDEQDEMHDDMDDIHDETIERIAAQLRPLPEVDPAARARVLVAVAAERERERDRQRRRANGGRRGLAWVSAAAAVAAAVALAVVLSGRPDALPDAAAPVASAPVAPAQPAPNTSVLAAADAGAAALRPVQLVFRAPAASRVSVVGDFSAWDPHGAVMTRDSGSGLWTVTLRLTPGRHVYAFLVDDSIWVRDPRAPSAPDADFGRPGSVLLVGHP